MNVAYLLIIFGVITGVFSLIISFVMIKQLKKRIALDRKLRKFLAEEITRHKLDVDKIESIIRGNTLTIVIEKEIPEDELSEFKKKIEIIINNAINRLADEERIIIYRSIQNSNRNNTSQYQNKILLDSINDLKHA